MAETEQQSRKRTLVNALHADKEDVEKGARWANIQVKGQVKMDARWAKPFVQPMRIEAVAGSHYVFQAPHNTGLGYKHRVVVLHCDEFDVGPWPETNWCADGFEDDFQHRFRRTCHHEDGDDEDDDDEEDAP